MFWDAMVCWVGMYWHSPGHAWGWSTLQRGQDHCNAGGRGVWVLGRGCVGVCVGGEEGCGGLSMCSEVDVRLCQRANTASLPVDGCVKHQQQQRVMYTHPTKTQEMAC